MSGNDHLAQAEPAMAEYNREELDAFMKCKRSMLQSVIPPTVIGGGLTYAIAFSRKMKQIRGLTALGVLLGYTWGTVRVQLECTKKIAQQFPDGQLAKNIARAQRLAQGGNQQQYEVQQVEQPVTSQQMAQQRMSEDYQAGFADSSSNVQHAGLADEKRRTVDDDSIMPALSSDSQESKPRRSYEDLRQENRRRFHSTTNQSGSSQPEGGVIGGILNQQNVAPQPTSKPSISSLGNMETRSAPGKPVRRNQYGDIIEE